MLGNLGLIPWFSRFVANHVAGWSWLPALGVLALVYMYSHYFFASLAAHTTAFFVPFLTVAVAAGAPPYFAALIFAFFSSLCVSLTHYGGGPSPVYCSAGYADIRQGSPHPLDWRALCGRPPIRSDPSHFLSGAAYRSWTRPSSRNS